MTKFPRLRICTARLSVFATLGVAVSLSGLLQGCAAPGTAMDGPKPLPAPGNAAKSVPRTASEAAAQERRDAAVPVLTAAQQTLASGIEAYNQGNFNNAIKRLGAAEILSADKATQLTALKYSAFSYCVTRRQTLCYQQFVKAFKLDPGFELAAGEKGHPLWTKAFDRAKKKK